MPVSTADLVSPAMACLRVSIHSAPTSVDSEALQSVVAKIIGAFLQTRWVWPRLFEQMTPYSFVLTDPRAEHMDKRALRALAGELQLKLFGWEGDGEVSLLMFEGEELEVQRFARLSIGEVERMLAGQMLEPPFFGTLDRILAEPPSGLPRAALPAPAPPADPEFDPPPRVAPSPKATHLEPIYSAIYLTMTQSFVGSMAFCRRPRRDRYLFPDLGGSEALPGLPADRFDEGCVESAVDALRREVAGLIFVPLSFSSLVKPGGRRAYARFLVRLPAEERDRLGVAIYDTPRAPSFSALHTIRRFLDPFFSEINLHVSDPGFEIDKLPPNLASSVTLVLPDREFAERIASVRRFMNARDAYKKKRVWPGVSPVLNAQELDVCVSLKAPVLSGPGVAELSKHPPGVRGIDLQDLPFAG